MVDLLDLHKLFLSAHIKKGGVAVDFTMGNGHDTLWLSNAVGENGRVYAFDIQSQALENTAALLKKENAPENYILIHDSHARVLEYVKEPFCAGVFNLGYLPGGDKSLTTLRPSTLEAVRGGLELLASGGILLIAVYPGHAEGALEGEMLQEELSKLDRHFISVSRFQIINSPAAPFFFAVEKK